MKRVVYYIRASLGLLLVFSLLLGGVYPLFATAVSQLLFHNKASGQLIERDGKIIGSALLGQDFSAPGYFWGRLSATVPAYNAAASGGSNFSAANPKLLETANARIASLKKADPKNKAKIPVELITASASGLDPHISLLAAEYQIGRVAKARGMSQEDLHSLIVDHVDQQSKIAGVPYVNVLLLNLALDKSKQ